MCANIDKKSEIVMENNEKSSRLYRVVFRSDCGHRETTNQQIFNPVRISYNFIIFVSVRF